MDYQVYVNNELFLSGNIFVVALIALFILILLVLIIKVIWRKLREYENLKYEFVTIIAHKFRTPLTQIKWILENIIPSEPDPFKLEPLKNLQATNEKLISLTGTLIELTESTNQTLAAYTFEKINISEEVTRVVNSLADRFHEKNLFFGIKCESPELFVKADKSRIEFVLQTLLENGINYSPMGKNIDILVFRKRRKVYIQVIDEGIGIDPADIPKLFAKFFRSHSAQDTDPEGFGVGLFLAQSIMKRHKGNIQASSPGLEKGSTFTVTLPLVTK